MERTFEFAVHDGEAWAPEMFCKDLRLGLPGDELTAAQVAALLAEEVFGEETEKAQLARPNQASSPVQLFGPLFPASLLPPVVVLLVPPELLTEYLEGMFSQGREQSTQPPPGLLETQPLVAEPAELRVATLYTAGKERKQWTQQYVVHAAADHNAQEIIKRNLVVPQAHDSKLRFCRFYGTRSSGIGSGDAQLQLLERAMTLRRLGSGALHICMPFEQSCLAGGDNRNMDASSQPLLPCKRSRSEHEQQEQGPSQQQQGLSQQQQQQGQELQQELSQQQQQQQQGQGQGQDAEQLERPSQRVRQVTLGSGGAAVCPAAAAAATTASAHHALAPPHPKPAAPVPSTSIAGMTPGGEAPDNQQQPAPSPAVDPPPLHEVDSMSLEVVPAAAGLKIEERRAGPPLGHAADEGAAAGAADLMNEDTHSQQHNHDPQYQEQQQVQGQEHEREQEGEQEQEGERQQQHQQEAHCQQIALERQEHQEGESHGSPHQQVPLQQEGAEQLWQQQQQQQGQHQQQEQQQQQGQQLQQGQQQGQQQQGQQQGQQQQQQQQQGQQQGQGQQPHQGLSWLREHVAAPLGLHNAGAAVRPAYLPSTFDCHKYQLQAVQFLQGCEAPGRLLALPSLPGSSHAAQSMTLPCGAMLFDSPGLGKTVEVLMQVAAPYIAQQSAAGSSSSSPAAAKTTLLIAPDTLLSHWHLHACMFGLSWLVWRPMKKQSCSKQADMEGPGEVTVTASELSAFQLQRKRSCYGFMPTPNQQQQQQQFRFHQLHGPVGAAELCKYDLVLVSIIEFEGEYNRCAELPPPKTRGALGRAAAAASAGEAVRAIWAPSPLAQVHFRRLVLDEGQEMGSGTRQRAKLASQLRASFKLFVTGTPRWSHSDLLLALGFLYSAKPTALPAAVAGGAVRSSRQSEQVVLDALSTCSGARASSDVQRSRAQQVLSGLISKVALMRTHNMVQGELKLPEQIYQMKVVDMGPRSSGVEEVQRLVMDFMAYSMSLHYSESKQGLFFNHLVGMCTHLQAKSRLRTDWDLSAVPELRGLLCDYVDKVLPMSGSNDYGITFEGMPLLLMARGLRDGSYLKVQSLAMKLAHAATAVGFSYAADDPRRRQWLQYALDCVEQPCRPMPCSLGQQGPSTQLGQPQEVQQQEVQPQEVQQDWWQQAPRGAPSLSELDERTVHGFIGPDDHSVLADIHLPAYTHYKYNLAFAGLEHMRKSYSARTLNRLKARVQLLWELGDRQAYRAAVRDVLGADPGLRTRLRLQCQRLQEARSQLRKLQSSAQAKQAIMGSTSLSKEELQEAVVLHHGGEGPGEEETQRGAAVATALLEWQSGRAGLPAPSGAVAIRDVLCRLAFMRSLPPRAAAVELEEGPRGASQRGAPSTGIALSGSRQRVPAQPFYQTANAAGPSTAGPSAAGPSAAGPFAASAEPDWVLELLSCSHMVDDIKEAKEAEPSKLSARYCPRGTLWHQELLRGMTMPMKKQLAMLSKPYYLSTKSSLTFAGSNNRLSAYLTDMAETAAAHGRSALSGRLRASAADWTWLFEESDAVTQAANAAQQLLLLLKEFRLPQAVSMSSAAAVDRPSDLLLADVAAARQLHVVQSRLTAKLEELQPRISRELRTMTRGSLEWCQAMWGSKIGFAVDAVRRHKLRGEKCVLVVFGTRSYYLLSLALTCMSAWAVNKQGEEPEEEEEEEEEEEDALFTQLGYEHLETTHWTDDGSFKLKQHARHGAVERFSREPQVTAFLLNVCDKLEAQAKGINLTCARHMYIVDPVLDCGVLGQAMSRIHRPGTSGSTHVCFLALKGSIEEDLWRSVTVPALHVICKSNGFGRVSTDSVSETTSNVPHAVVDPDAAAMSHVLPTVQRGATAFLSWISL